jgi:hypothetical protein
VCRRRRSALSTHPRKSACSSSPVDSTRPASADLTALRSSIADITKFVRNYFRCGGIAVGPDPAAVDDYARRAAVCEYRTHVDHLAHSPLQIQLKNVLFARSRCGKHTTMLTYMIRAVAPNLTAESPAMPLNLPTTRSSTRSVTVP